MSLTRTLDIAGSALSAQSVRLNTVASNLASDSRRPAAMAAVIMKADCGVTLGGPMAAW